MGVGPEAAAYRVRISARARRARLVVGAEGPPEVVLPRGAAPGAAERLVAEHAPWLARQLRRRDARREAAGRLGLDRAGTAWIDLLPLPIVHRPGAPSRAALRAGRVEVTGPHQRASAAVERLLRREARRVLSDDVAREAAPLGLPDAGSAGLAIRDPRARWASCSAAGGLSFSWRLLMAPPAVRAAVVVHELCHLRQLNHSPAFWALLDAARPGWRAEHRWLADHGAELRAHRPSVTPIREGTPRCRTCQMAVESER